MKYYIFVIVGLLSLSCTDVFIDVPNPYKPKKEATFAVNQSGIPLTRTTIVDGDPNTISWSKEDHILLWAKESGSSNYVINGVDFELSHYSPSFNKAIFKGEVSGQNSGATYSYFGVYPKAKRMSGSNVVMSIPSTQSGVYDGSSDVMAANPVLGESLSLDTDKNLVLSFRHLTHAIRFQVPSSDRYPMAEKITRMVVTFPQYIAGDLSFDASVANVIPSFSNGSKVITLNFVKPLQVGDYFWAFIKPGVINGNISINAYSDEDGDGNEYIAQTLKTTLRNREMRAGHVTPITLTIDEAPRTTLHLKISKNNLGESVTKAKFTAPKDCKFRDGSTSYIHNFKSQSDVVVLEYYTNHNSSNFKSEGVDVVFESTNVLFKEATNISLSSIKANQINIINMTVPYLFDEDFSSVTSFDKNTDHKLGDTGHGKTIDLEDKGLPGWTADRAGGKEKTSIRTVARLEGGIGIQAIYHGRIDSPPMTNIKEGKIVKVKVSYSCSGGRKEGAGRKKGTPKYNHGYTNKAGIQSGSNGIENTVDSNIEQGIDGNYDKVDQSKSYYIDKCEDDIRLSWYANVSRRREFGQNGNYWLYIDNVKVQISK